MGYDGVEHAFLASERGEIFDAVIAHRATVPRGAGWAKEAVVKYDSDAPDGRDQQSTRVPDAASTVSVAE